eukprot:g24213.t1
MPRGRGSGGGVTLEQFLGLDRLNDPEARLTLNVACANGTFNAEYYNGPSSAELAREYLAWVGPGANQNHVSYVTTTDEELITTLHRTKLSIPVGWPEGQRPEFSFVDNKGRWHRRNRLQTKEEIKVDEAATVKICWGAFDGGRQQYYGEAGVLEFSAPTFMADAGVYLTTRVQGGLGMAVLSFSPSRGTTFYKAYQVPVVVRLLFKEVDFMLEPLLSGEELSELEALPVEDQVLMENATQTICGKLFMEMWTNDDSGFPFPRGCYYGPLYDDAWLYDARTHTATMHSHRASHEMLLTSLGMP